MSSPKVRTIDKTFHASQNVENIRSQCFLELIKYEVGFILGGFWLPCLQQWVLKKDSLM